MDRNAHEQGFSLLEVLVSFVILALTLTVLLRAYGTSVRNAGLAEQHLRAATVAESLLARLGRDVALQPGEASGAIGAYRWQWVIQPYELPPVAPLSVSNQALEAEQQEGEGAQQENAPRTLPEAFQIRLTLAWGAAARTRSVTLSTLRIARQIESEKAL
ncbi:MAG: type IV pilus modification PilV family protein [Gammaproteobacteria bacterium]